MTGWFDIYHFSTKNNLYPAATIRGGKATQGEAAVSFLYRDVNVVPKEVAGNVQVEDMPPMLVVSIGVKGGYGYGVYAEAVQRLGDWLAENPEYGMAGPPRRFFYDGPFIPNGLKRSDIQIPVERN